MPPVQRILKLAGLGLGLVMYVWVAAVRNLPYVKARKARRRAARRR